MDQHGIDISVVRCACAKVQLPFNCVLKLFQSSANPWLDFLSESNARSLAETLNEDIEKYCEASPNLKGTSLKRIYGFGLLPLVPSVSTQAVVDTVEQVAKLPHLKGIIMGTKGVGKGLDDTDLEPVWEALERHQLVVFLHPHYGVGKSEWGPRENGHVLPLALGFPMETTIVSKTIVAFRRFIHFAFRR